MLRGLFRGREELVIPAIVLDAEPEGWERDDQPPNLAIDERARRVGTGGDVRVTHGHVEVGVGQRHGEAEGARVVAPVLC